MGKLTIIDGKKQCRKCHLLKDEALFNFAKDKRFGKRYIKPCCKECDKVSTYEWRKNNPTKAKYIDKKSRDKIRELVIAHYGRGGKPVCVWCGFGDSRALCIDHINDDGAKERRTIRDKYFCGSSFYRWVRDNGFPPRYQTLCANCNQIKETIRRRKNANHNSSQLDAREAPTSRSTE